jgi:hypothetical protein
MDKSTVRDVAEQAINEENLSWSIADIAPNPNNQDEWEIYYDAWGPKYHKILERVMPGADTTRESLKAEVRDFLQSLKNSGWL